MEVFSLLLFVTLKVNNEIGLNFESCRPKDCSHWEKYENAIYGAISVSYYGLIEHPSTRKMNLTCTC